MKHQTSSVTTRSFVLGAAAALTVALAAPARAQITQPTDAYQQAPGVASSALPKPLREIGFDQNLGRQLPLDAQFRDEQGRTVRLADYFGKRPVVLSFVYYDCPMLCTQVLNSEASTLNILAQNPGQDFEIVTISIDPREKPELARAKKAAYLERYRRAGAAEAWHFLTGDEPEIKRVTAAAGFRYVWDNDLKQFAHPTGIIVVTPQGKLARYLFGVEYGPRDLRLAMLEASDGKIGTAVDNLLLYCYHYDPATGRYGFVIMRGLRIAGVATILGFGAFIFVLARKDKHVAPPTASRFPKV